MEMLSSRFLYLLLLKSPTRLEGMEMYRLLLLTLSNPNVSDPP